MFDPTPRPLPGLPRRVFAVFVSPGELFERLRSQPAWGGAVLLAVVLNLATMLLMPTELFVEQIRTGIEQSGADPSDVPIEMMVTIGRYSAIAVAGLMAVVIAFAVGAIMFVMFATLLGDDGRYRQYLSVAAHALIVTSVGGLLVAPLRILQSDLEVRLSVGTFLPFLGDGSLATFLSMLDLFGLWGVMLAALGATKIHPGRSWGSAFAVLAVFWLAFAAGMTALASLGS